MLSWFSINIFWKKYYSGGQCELQIKIKKVWQRDLRNKIRNTTWRELKLKKKSLILYIHNGYFHIKVIRINVILNLIKYITHVSHWFFFSLCVFYLKRKNKYIFTHE